MDRHGRDGFRRRSRRLVVPGILLLLPVLFAQTQEAGIKPELVISPELPRETQQFTLSFLIPHPIPQDIRMGPDVRFPPSAVLIGGPGINPVSEKDPVTGAIERFIRIHYVFRASQAGRSIVEPLSFRIGEKEYTTESALLEIAQRRGEPLVPFDLAWIIPQTEIYEGQTVAAFLEMQNLTGITMPDTVSVTPPARVVFEEVKGLGGITSLVAGNRELYRMTVASYLLTPSAPGRIVLPAARVKALGLTVESRQQALTVKPLPPAVRSTGAVGRFQVTSRLGREEMTLGDTVELVVRIEGAGNLNYLQLPDLVYPDVVVTGKTGRSSLLPSETGYQGFMEWEVRISPQKAGDFRLTVPPFPWLDPESGRIHTSRERVHRIAVRERVIQDEEGKARKDHKILRSEEIMSFQGGDAYRNIYLYGLLVPGLIVLVQGLLRRKGKSLLAVFGLICLSGLFIAAGKAPVREIPQVERGADAFEAGDYPEAEKAFLQAADGLPGNPGIDYNLGLTYRALDNPSRAVFHLRRAAVQSPGTGFFREALLAVEKHGGLLRQTPVPSIHPDFFFIFFIVSFLAACTLPWLVKRRGVLLISFIIFLLPIGLSLGGAAYQAAERNSRWGVVAAEGTVMRKIPLPNSSEWLYLQEGTSVGVRGHSDNFILVRTGFGVEGWVDAKKLLLDRSGLADEK